MKSISLKLEEKQLELLDKVSKSTHIPKSALIRQGIDLILQRTKEDLISPEIRQEIDQLIAEDRDVLKRLAE